MGGCFPVRYRLCLFSDGAGKKMFKKCAEPRVYINTYILIPENTVMCVWIPLTCMPRTQKYAEFIRFELTGPKGLQGLVYWTGTQAQPKTKHFSVIQIITWAGGVGWEALMTRR